MAYKLTHPESDQTIEVTADRVPMYESQGWQTAPTAKDPEPEKAPKK